LAYQVLARKWRPQKFSDVVGQKHVVKTLKNALKLEHIVHSYLFTGARGIGKTSIARIFAKALCCENPQDLEPCNECSSCKEIIASSSIDVQEIDGASNNGVDSIRAIKENVAYPPVKSKYKLYIIDEAHMLSTSAFNALLKTLEEPPSYALFMLATTEPHKIPKTILSRCQRFDLKKLSLHEIMEHLQLLCNNEGVSIDPSAISAIAREAKGSSRDALSTLDQVIAYAGKDIGSSLVNDVLGLIDKNYIEKIATAIIEKNSKECSNLTSDIYDKGYDIKKVCEDLLIYFRNLLFVKLEGIESLKELSDSEITSLKELSKKVSSHDIEQLFYLTNTLLGNISYSQYPTMIFEVGILGMSQKVTNIELSDLINELKKKNNSNTLPLTEEPKKKTPSAAVKKTTTFNWKEFYQYLIKQNKELQRFFKPVSSAKLEKNKMHISYLERDRRLFQELSNHRDLFKLFQEILYEYTGRIIEIEATILEEQKLTKKDIENHALVKEAQQLFSGVLDKVTIYNKNN
jgi:DNA polymerase-3 subunit gamma/tau